MDSEQKGNTIGLFKNLKSTEELCFESKIITEIMFLKEVESRRLGRHLRQEIPISLCKANIYMTGERLLFLVLYQINAVNMSDDKKSKTSSLSGVSGSWFEMPLSAVQQVEMRPLKLLKGKEMDNFLKKTYSDDKERDDFMGRPSVELVYDEQATEGRAKDYMRALFKSGMFTKLEKAFDKIIIVGEEVVTILPTIKAIIK